MWIISMWHLEPWKSNISLWASIIFSLLKTIIRLTSSTLCRFVQCSEPATLWRNVLNGFYLFLFIEYVLDPSCHDLCTHTSCIHLFITNYLVSIYNHLCTRQEVDLLLEVGLGDLCLGLPSWEICWFSLGNTASSERHSRIQKF